MELEQLMGDSVPLEELFPPKTENSKVPENMARDRSSKLSIVSSPVREPVITYQTLIAEHKQGMDGLNKTIENEVRQRKQNWDLKSVNEILSDSTIPFEQKDKVIREFNKSNFVDIEEEVLIKEVVKNPETNNPEHEAKVTSVMDRIREVNRAAVEKQNIANSIVAEFDSSTANAFGDLLETIFVPFSENKQIAGIVDDLKKGGAAITPGSFTKAFLLAGGTKAQLNEAFLALPVEKQMDFMRSLAPILKESKSLLGSNDFAAFNFFMDITDPTGYGGVQEAMDNVFPYLDAVGLGWTLKGFKKVLKPSLAPQATPVAPSVNKTPVEAPMAPARASATVENIFESATVSKPPVDTVGRPSELDSLISQRASLLGDSSGLAARVDVREITTQLDSLEAPVFSKERVKEVQQLEDISYKQALSKVEKEHKDLMADYNATKQRLEGILEGNRAATKNEQTLADLDVRIDRLQKELEANPVFQETQLVRAMQQVEWNSVKGVDNPVSTGRLMGSVNETSGRNLHAAVLNAPDDEFAQAMFGANKVDVIAHDILPQVTHAGGKVDVKVSNIDGALKLQLDPEVLRLAKSTEGLGITPRERDMMFTAYKNDFANATGLNLQNNMSSFSVDSLSGNFKYAGTFGSADGAFADVVSAVNETRYALSKFGVTENNITILQRKGNDLVPVDKNNVPSGPGEFYVRVEGENAFDITGFSLDALEVKKNFFDHNPVLVGKRGSLSRYFMDLDSMLDPTYTQAAAVAGGRSSLLDKTLLKLADEAATIYRKLDEGMRQSVDQYLIKANINRTPATYFNMKGAGLSDDAIRAVEKWKEFWDNHYYLENYDLVRTLNSQGYEILDNGTDKFFTKGLKTLNAVPLEATRVYDPTLQTLVDVSRADVKALYDNSGYVARLRRPSVINGELVEYIKIRNNPNEYLRKLNDNDTVIDYREGYFQINYKAPKFVDEMYTDIHGRKIRRAVAVAGDSLEAEAFADRMRKTNSGKEYVVRGDDRALQRGSDEFWDLQSVSGRIAQRHRGQTLEDASGANHLGVETSYIMDPAEAAIKASHSISARTMMRPVLDNAKERFVKQYGHLLEASKNSIGQVEFPSDVAMIGQKGRFTSGEIADARTTWEAINYWENGYINAADDIIKGAFNKAGEILSKYSSQGNKAAAKAERIVNQMAEGDNPTSWAKSSVFTAFIGTFPHRQWITQTAAVIRLAGYTGPQAALDVMRSTQNLFLEHILGKVPKDKDLYEFIRDSGMLDSVDRSNLVRGALLDAAESSSQFKRGLGKTLNFPRKIGFDAAERVNRAAHLTAVFNKYRREGKDIENFDIRTQMQKEADALGYSMNMSNDMIYNQGSLSFLLQFAQVPHKAFLQYSNRNIPWEVRKQLIATDLILYGPLTAIVSAMYNYDWMPENKQLADVVKDGFQSVVLNRVYQDLIGDDERTKKLDFQALNPQDISGWIRLWDTFMEKGFSEMIANSPAGNLWFKDGGKFQNVLGTMTRFWSPIDPSDNNIETFLHLVQDVAKLSSGFDYAYRAAMILDAEKVIDMNSGELIKDKASKMDALAMAFGFQNYERSAMIEASQALRKLSKEDAEKVAIDHYKEYKRYLTRTLKTDETDVRWQQNVTGYIMRTYKDNPFLEDVIRNEFRKDLMGRDINFVRQLLKMSGHTDVSELKAIVMQSPLSDVDKKRVLEDIDHAQNYKLPKEE